MIKAKYHLSVQRSKLSQILIKVIKKINKKISKILQKSFTFNKILF